MNKRGWVLRKERYGESGVKNSKERNRKVSETRKRLFKEGKLINPMFNPSSREKVRLSQLGQKNSMYGKKPHNFGKTKENYKPLKVVSDKKKAYKFTEEHKINIGLGKKGKKRSKKERKSLSLAQFKKWQDRDYKKKQLNAIFEGFKLRPTEPEKKVIEIIKKYNFPFNYVGDGKIWFRGKNQAFNPDFLSKNPKHIIEVFGDYWHNLPNARKRDRERLKTYAKYGYDTLVIWESELKNIISVVNKIKEFGDG